MEIFVISDSMYKPLIGIIGRPTKEIDDKFNISTREEYRQAIIKMKGVPILILPPQLINYYTTRVSETKPMTKKEKEILEQELNLCDGIILPGGFKMSEYDTFVIEYCIKNNKPILGICLGMQEMANYSPNKEENSIILEKNNEKGINHCKEETNYVHNVKLNKNSIIYNLLNKEEFKVNSIHNYHVTKSNYYAVAGYSEDGLIEVVEYKNNTFNIGVQWHPERLLDDKLQYKLLKEFIKSCIVKKQQKL